ncbi:hypothetical protein ABZ615_23345 [Streptomyces sp. NPDC007325]|uniref:hypothetical protein n=1 Tax=Streptomyces sp. NPDC007325 TaxID=3154588 RepID=UPI0033E2EBB6
MQRRDFATALAAALTAPTLIGASPAQAADRGGSGGGTGLTARMRGALADEIDDPRTARALAPYLYDVGFDWHPETAELNRFDFVVAYGFGNRPAKSGDPATTLPEPGPVNEDLAGTVARIRSRRNVPVYAQWEIARFLESTYGMTGVTSIEPVVAEDGTITYLSTDGVAAQVLEHRKKAPGGIGTACVVGFADHHKRCVQTTRDRGMSAYAPRGVAMPRTYDPESGQEWTRRRDLYLVHDMAAQWQVLRAKLIAEATTA